MAKVVDSVEGLLWGTYIGSPSESEPIVIWKARQETPISRLVSVTSNEIYGVPKFSTVAVLYNREEGNASSKNPSAVSGSFLIQWNHPGLAIVCFSVNKKSPKGENIVLLLPLLPPTPLSWLETFKRLFEMTAPFKGPQRLVRCFRNYRDTRIHTIRCFALGAEVPLLKQPTQAL